MASVEWSRGALLDLDVLDAVIARRIVAKVSWLAKHFSDTVPEHLHNDLRRLYKLRVGDYRAIYSIKADLLTIEAVKHRREIYR